MANTGKLSAQEEQIVTQKFKTCCARTASDHIVFAYPSEFTRGPTEVCDRLERAYEFLERATPVSIPPITFFGKRVIIGYRHPQVDNDPNVNAGWFEPENRINVPWDRLQTPEDVSFATKSIHVGVEHQPEFVCSHELAHPFEHIFLRNNRNKKWKEGICDFLRVFLLREMRLEALSLQWEKVIEDARAHKTHNKHHDAAGRIAAWCERSVGSLWAVPCEVLRGLIAELIAAPMDEILDPNGEIDFSDSS